MSIDDFETALNASLDRADRAFRGTYKAEVEALLRLSAADISAITPEPTALETYNKLIAVVQEASAHNLSQAALKQRVIQLGETAVSIAKSVTSLALKIGL